MSRRDICRLLCGFIILAIIVPALAACGTLATLPTREDPVGSTQPAELTPPFSEPSGSKVLQSKIQRDLNPDVNPVDLKELIGENTAFALDFYQAVRDESGNLFFSPYSLSIALAMTYAGARTNTETQMGDTLHFSLPQGSLHPAFNALDLELADREAEVSAQDDGQSFQLSIANSLWAQYDYPFLPEFLDLLAMNYGAGLRLIDFISDPEAARQEINAWVEEMTQERIKDLIPKDAIDDYTRLVLANAIYFNADWMHPFANELTGDASFNLLDGGQVEVPMMVHSTPVDLPYTAGEGYQAVELPYTGNTTSMVILVPDTGKFEEFEAGLDSSKLANIISSLEQRTVNLNLPKFTFESRYDLAETLAAMGMPDAFDLTVADFSGMDGTKDLYIGDVFHKAFVSVDEKGTEAAAATAVIVQLEIAIMADINLIVDRPFIFLIQDKPTGSILFLGRVLDPSK